MALWFDEKMMQRIQSYSKSSRRLFPLILFIPLLFTRCFFGGAPNSGKAVAYHSGLIQMKKGFYQVGKLSEGWKRSNIGKYKTVAFYHGDLKSSLTTNAFCDESYEDASLKVLSNHLHFALQKPKTRFEKILNLDHREAFRSVLEGSLDGVPVVLDTVVIKKDNCVFDFALISDPDHYEQAALDFQNFYEGFHYQGD